MNDNSIEDPKNSIILFTKWNYEMLVNEIPGICQCKKSLMQAKQIYKSSLVRFLVLINFQMTTIIVLQNDSKHLI